MTLHPGSGICSTPDCADVAIPNEDLCENCLAERVNVQEAIINEHAAKLDDVHERERWRDEYLAHIGGEIE